MRGRCQCGEWVDVVVVDRALTAPGHSCHGPGARAALQAPPARPRVARAPAPRPAVGAWPFVPTAALAGRTLRLWLPRAMRSAEGPNGRSWKRKAAAAAQWRQLVAQALEVLGDRRPSWQRARVAYQLFGAQPMDPDNVVALGKPILDGLVAAAVLPDDRAEHVAGVTGSWARTALPWGFVRVSTSDVTDRRRRAPPRP